jgi:hypothetical protein
MKLKIIILVVVLILVLFFLSKNIRLSVKGFVTNATFDKSEDPIFKYEVIKYPCNFEIKKIRPQEEILIGVTVETWNLNFGTIPAGNRARRYIVLTNNKDERVKVNFNVYGNITPMISFSKNNFLISKNENLTITVSLITTNTTSPGNYSGEIDVVTKIPKYNFSQRLLELF